MEACMKLIDCMTMGVHFKSVLYMFLTSLILIWIHHIQDEWG